MFCRSLEIWLRPQKKGKKSWEAGNSAENMGQPYEMMGKTYDMMEKRIQSIWTILEWKSLMFKNGRLRIFHVLKFVCAGGWMIHL